MNIPVHAFGGHMCMFLIGIYLGGELLDHRVCICSALLDTTKQLFKVVLLIYFPTSHI